MISAMTSYDKVITQELRTGFYRRDLMEKSPSFCGSGKPGYRYTQYWFAFPPTGSWPVSKPVPKDWSTGVLLQLKDTRMNLGTYLAEYRETCSQFGSLAKDMFHIFNEVRTGKFSKIVKRIQSHTTLGDLANAKLAYAFGIAPTMSDLSEALDRLNSNENLSLFRRFTYKQDCDDNLDYQAWQGNYKIKQRIVYYMEMDTNIDPNFTAGNPAETLWEAIPFSFVIDWMIPIGDYLSAIDAMTGWRFKAGCISTKELMWMTPELTPPPPYGWLEKPQVNYHSYQRATLLSLPKYPALPTYEPSKSLNSVLNGLALLKQLKSSI
jgi:hypothetical protein